MSRHAPRLLLVALMLAYLLPVATPASAQSDDYIRSQGVVRFGFMLPDGQTVHYRLPVDLKAVLDGIWNSKLPDLNARIVQVAMEESDSLDDVSSRLSLADQAELQVKQDGDILSLRYIVPRNKFNATLEVPVLPDPSFEVTYDLWLTLNVVVTDLAHPFTLTEATASIHNSEVSGTNLIGDIFIFIGQLFGASSKIERAINGITVDMTGEVNSELQPRTAVLTRYVPAGFQFLDSSVDRGGTISLCFKLSPDQHCDFPDSSVQPPFLFPPVLTSASLSGPPDLGVWYRDAATLLLNTVGGSGGPIRTMYRINNGPDLEATGPVVIAEDGTHQIAFYSVDSTGEREPDQTLTINIDRTAPAITLTANDAPIGPSGRYSRPTAVHITLDDRVSGLAQASLELYRHQLLLSTITSGDGTLPPVTLTEDGSYTLRVTATDHAGNVAVVTQAIDLDRDPPRGCPAKLCVSVPSTP